MSNSAGALFLVQPDSFGYNEQTAKSNSFQHHNTHLSPQKIQRLALEEFNHCSSILARHHIKHLIYHHPPQSILPDAVFPNNWFCHLPNHKLLIFPMESQIRRAEKIPTIHNWLQEHKIRIDKVVDLSKAEDENAFLEGTGSLILDHNRKIGWAALSSRTTIKGIEHFVQATGYQIISYNTIPQNNVPVYHTNVIQAISPNMMILAADVISDSDRNLVFASIYDTGRDILIISANQMRQFCGNILFIENIYKKPFWIMSETAFKGFSEDQIKKLRLTAELLIFPIPIIETTGGGSARCMLAELF